MNCQFYAGDDAVECTDAVAGRDETGTPLCETHLAQSTDYDHPRMGDGGAARNPPQEA